jgi:Transposase DDE domain
MSRRKRSNAQRRTSKQRRKQARWQNKSNLAELLRWVLPEGQVFSKEEFHGNTRWSPEQLAAQALVWSWQETKNVTDAFVHAREVCEELGWEKTALTYTAFMNALDHYNDIWMGCLRRRYQSLAEEIGGRFFRTGSWVLIGFDGSRATTPRTASNERAFCAPNYGHGKRAKYGKKKSKGLRRKRNKERPPQPPAPQAWITMMWHMGLRLPWTWRLGPSHASERDHVKAMLTEEEFPENTLFCGDAGFVGYPLWSAILKADADFVVRVGANVKLLSEHADVKRLGGGIVLCWPKGQMESGQPPLRLRLVQVQVGKTKVWLLTSVLDRKRLGRKQLIRIYKMRWGIEVEFRGLKQTIDKHMLRCRNSDRVLAELGWSLCGMAIAELLALREQIATKRDRQQDDAYDPQDRSLANTMRALRRCMRNLGKNREPANNVRHDLSQAKIQRYTNHTDKRARYRPPNPDKKPLGDPIVRKINAIERDQLRKHRLQIAA